jgi:hypothetical protein
MFNFIRLIKTIMSGVNQGWAFWWNYFKSIFNFGDYSITGSIVLGPGLQEVEITAPYPNPVSIYVNATEPPDATGTCIGDLNWVATRMSAVGFTLFANITSNSCTVEYIINYDANVTTPTDPSL